MLSPPPMPGPTPEELERLRSSSGLSMDRDGRFRHEGTLIEHPRIDEALRRGLGRSPDGRATVAFGPTWAYLAVEETLYRVRLARCEADGDRLAACALALDDGTEEPLALAPGVLAVDAAGVLFARVKAGREWARCLPAAHAALGGFLVDRGGALALSTTLGDLEVASR